MRKMLIGLLILAALPLVAQTKLDFVNPMIGTGGHGHTFPGPCVPNGLVQLSPTTDITGWDWASGYHYDDNTMLGFSHTHLSGTGVGDLGDIVVMPRTGKPQTAWGSRKEPFPSMRQTFSHADEVAKVGYYSVKLQECNILAELSATQRCGIHRYTFPKSDSSYILVNPTIGIGGREKAQFSKITIEDDYTISGYRISFGWVPFQRVYYVIKSSKKFDFYFTGNGRDPRFGTMEEENVVCYGGVYFKTEAGEKVTLKVGISTVSIENAKANLEVEIPDFDFDKVVKQAQDKWLSVLNLIDVEGGKKEKEIFYTGLYHAYIHPNNLCDVNGEYQDVKYEKATSNTGSYYSTFSLWDTYRAAHPLYTIITPKLAGDFVKTMVEHHEKQGFLPIWTLWGAENYCMIANHAIPVVVDAYNKKLLEPEWHQRAFKAVYESSTRKHKGSEWDIYTNYGYYPYDIVNRESVSKTLEINYNDWCVASMAKSMGKTAEAAEFEKRSNFHRNLFDASVGFYRARDSKGNFMPNFEPRNIMHSHGYTEANAWQYLWSVQHDVPALIQLLGGPKKFEAKLDTLFNTSSAVVGDLHDVTGFIGQYVHGNEPSHHVAYLYNYVGKPEKARAMLRKVYNNMYNNQPDGYAGNEDCGQMSAWYILSSMGFYPVNPANSIYDLGLPVFSKATINLPNGKKFVVTSDLSDTKTSVKSVTLNGKPVKNNQITHNDIINGGNLVFKSK